jgi:hypothetical protein
LAGEVPRQGVVVEGVKRVKYAPMPPEIYKNGEKRGGFPHFLAYKLPKMLFFTQKYLTRYTPTTFLRNASILNFSLLKGTVQRDFLPPSFSLMDSSQATYSVFKDFSNLASNSVRYSGFLIDSPL